MLLEAIEDGRFDAGEHVRVFPLSSWTELDVWHYIEREQLELPSIYLAHDRRLFERDGMLLLEVDTEQDDGVAAVARLLETLGV